MSAPLLLHSQPIDPIKRSGLVALCQRGIVEHGVDEVFHFAFERHHRLPDMDEFARAFADDVHAEQFMCFEMEDQFQESGLVADDLSACDFAVLRLAHFVGDACFREFLFVAPDG